MNITTAPLTRSADFLRPSLREVSARREAAPGLSVRPVPNASPAHVERRCPYSERQLQILELLAEGHTSEAVASRLHISRETVRTHRQHILRRSGRPNMIASITEALRAGWI